MTQGFELSAEELLLTLQRRGIPLPCEIGAFITLEVCEYLLDRPAKVDAREIVISEIGEVLCPMSARTVSELEAVDGVIVLLSEFLVCAAPGVPSMLIDVIEHSPHNPERSLAGLLSELEASLMPLNRGATRRVIARLVREAKKAGPSLRSPESAQPLAAEVDATFDALVRSEPAAQPEALASLHSMAAAESAADLLELRSPQALPPSMSRRPRESLRLDADPLVESQSVRARIGVWLFGLSTMAALGLLLVYFVAGGDEAHGALGHVSDRVPADAASHVNQPHPVLGYGDLLVSSRPTRAQVLLLIGRGPALATDVPLGVVQEFVAVAEGYAPARALIPADAAWDELDGRPRYELAVQERPLRADQHGPLVGLGSTLLPHDVGTARSRLGSVRVVTTPPGANVYQVIGFTPDVRVENLRLDRSYELVVYCEGRDPVTRRVGPEDFREQAGNKRLAVIEVQLERSSGGSG